MNVYNSLPEAVIGLKKMRLAGESIGSVHSLGDLHEGHEYLITKSVSENDRSVVTLYANESQLSPGAKYNGSLELDLSRLQHLGVSDVIVPSPGTMFPTSHCTYLEQGERTLELDSTVVPHLYRGMISMSFRWVNFVRPDRTYWGMKDIAQTLLLERALLDFNVDVTVVRVPCARFLDGVPVSSRLKRVEPNKLREVAIFYGVLRSMRDRLSETPDGENLSRIIAEASAELASECKFFQLVYLKIVSAESLKDLKYFETPFVIHGCITDGVINHFDGFLVETRSDLTGTPETVWMLRRSH